MHQEKIQKTRQAESWHTRTAAPFWMVQHAVLVVGNGAWVARTERELDLTPANEKNVLVDLA